jgi:argininosuccinate lyase
MTKKLWGGRFEKKTDPLVEDFTRSIQYDCRLAKWDCFGSIAHVHVLKRAGYLKAGEALRLIAALTSITKSVEEGSFSPDPRSEDIHTDIQNKVIKAVGDLGLKLHTARSRNDQVVLATKLYCQSALEKTVRETDACVVALRKLASTNKNLIIPGFTHLQHAQPVLLKDFLGAYACMLERDKVRLSQAAKNIIPSFGAGALAGTPIASRFYAVNDAARKIVTQPVTNSLDTVSDRDFVIEIMSALSIVAMHLSRFAEDITLWATKEFGFVTLDDAFCTGSSLMPQKKNPDVLELTRGYAGRLYGNLVSVLTMMKGLPLTYNRDMQLDKEPLFSSFDIVSQELRVLTGLVSTLSFKKKKIASYLEDESLYATDIVYYLVDKKVPFQVAHTIVGKLVKYSLGYGVLIKDLPEETLKGFSKVFVKKEVAKLFDPVVSVQSKKSIKRAH